MDKVKKYKAAARKVAEYIASISPSDENVETQLITDDEHGHYLLYSVGWEKTYREYGAFVHMDVKPDGKVWLQHDGTDLRVALLLVEEGVPKKDIVLAFQAPHRRELLPEFALS